MLDVVDFCGVAKSPSLGFDSSVVDDPNKPVVGFDDPKRLPLLALSLFWVSVFDFIESYDFEPNNPAGGAVEEVDVGGACAADVPNKPGFGKEDLSWDEKLNPLDFEGVPNKPLATDSFDSVGFGSFFSGT